jgi:HSP20 family protein
MVKERMSWRRRTKRSNWNDDDDEQDNGSNDIMNPFDFDFRLGFGDIDEMIKSMFKAANSLGTQGPAPGAVYYGYSVNVGPDGKPHVREFGNVRPTSKGTMQVGSREPFVDTVVDDKTNELKVVAEMPGVQREDIHLEALENSLTVRAEHGERKYDTTVPLSHPVDTSTASATYNNGVLEVRMKLKGSLKPKGVNIKID